MFVLWLAVAFALVAAAVVLGRVVLRSRRWTARADAAVDTGQTVYERLAADLALASINGSVPSGLAESRRLLDVLTGQLAELARGPGDESALTALADLREEVDALRQALHVWDDVHIDAGEATTASSRRLVIYEVSLRTFRNTLTPPGPSLSGATR